MNPSGSPLIERAIRCVGKISTPGERVETSTANVRVAAGSSVAMVAVGDQQRHVELELRGREAPDLRAHAALLDVHVGLAVRPFRDGVGVIEEEDRLELSPRRAQQAQTAFLGTGVGELVRQHLAVRVGRHLDRRRQPLARPVDVVGAGELLGDPPERRLLEPHHTPLPPVGEGGGGRLLGLGQSQVDDVVRARLEVGRAQRFVDHVVGRSDEIVELTGHGFVVTERPEREDRGHGRRLP
jgi:hypothetical protein